MRLVGADVSRQLLPRSLFPGPRVAQTRMRCLYDAPDFFEILSHCFSVSIFTLVMYISVKSSFKRHLFITELFRQTD
jgi:hypothetical protein